MSHLYEKRDPLRAAVEAYNSKTHLVCTKSTVCMPH